MKTERERRLDAIYRAMHADYKGRINGVRTVMVLRGGSVLIALDDMTDEEMARYEGKRNNGR